jgi:hypothetical protein
VSFHPVPIPTVDVKPNLFFVQSCFINDSELVVVLHDNPVDDFLLNDFVPLLQGGETIRRGCAFAPQFHRGCMLIINLSLDAQPLKDGTLNERDKLDAVVRMSKVIGTDASVATLICGWLDDAVDRSLVEATR